eukprot:c56212_g1_i1.p1 GENE.c56212_g1_i1~~c56212_g1_i1.p1  ORF type:complete len:191 (-),score=26.94 c56212_g1_i1:216-788(-)
MPPPWFHTTISRVNWVRASGDTNLRFGDVWNIVEGLDATSQEIDSPIVCERAVYNVVFQPTTSRSSSRTRTPATPSITPSISAAISATNTATPSPSQSPSGSSPLESHEPNLFNGSPAPPSATTRPAQRGCGRCSLSIFLSTSAIGATALLLGVIAVKSLRKRRNNRQKVEIAIEIAPVAVLVTKDHVID